MTFELGFSLVGCPGGKVRVFVSYDREHDGDLYELLVEQAARPTSRFEISGRSTARPPADLWDERLHREMRSVDQVIVICGEHTDRSQRVAAELHVAQEEERPYFLLWGRRERMCTRPTTARSADSMYSWTWEILHDQILAILRAAQADDRRAELKRAKTSPAS